MTRPNSRFSYSHSKEVHFRPSVGACAKALTLRAKVSHVYETILVLGMSVEEDSQPEPIFCPIGLR